MHACLTGKPKAVAKLLALGANPLIGEKDGYTPMHGAAFQGRAEVARILLQDSRVPNIVHKDGFHPIHRAAWGHSKGHADTLQAFVEAGVNFRLLSEDSSPQSPLFFSKKAKNKDAIALLTKLYQEHASEL